MLACKPGFQGGAPLRRASATLGSTVVATGMREGDGSGYTHSELWPDFHDAKAAV